MKVAAKTLKAAAKHAATRAGREVAQRLVEVRDEILIEAGRAAEERQHRREVQHRWLKAGKIAAVAGAAAAALATGVAVRRARRRASG